MKKIVLIAAIALAAGARSYAQTADSLGLPGDNLDLYGVIDLFKASSSLEDFEKKLNEESNQLNNLDLDEDGSVDYISVVDNVSGDAHAIQLQVAVNDTERQDVAVIEVEKNGAESADLQVVGDEELYGKDYIIEANEDNAASSSEGHLRGFRATVVVVNVWVWPCVKFIYAPGYVVWVSPWHYRHYPGWWKPWHPVVWGVYHPRVVRYHHPYYHCVHVHRVARAHVVYNAHHRAAPSVHRRVQAHANGRVVPPREHGSGHATGKQGKGGKQAPKQAPRGGKQGGPKQGPKGGRH